MYGVVLLFIISQVVPARGQTLTDRLTSLFYTKTCEDLRQSLFEVEELSECSDQLGCPLNQHCEPFTCHGLYIRRCVSNFALNAACRRSAQCSSNFCHPISDTCQPDAGACPPDMLNAGGICLHLSAFSAASWPDARLACRALFGPDASLVSPSSEAEQQNLQTFLVLRSGSDLHPYIGVSDLVTEGEFVFDKDQQPVDEFSAFPAAQLALNDVINSCATQGPAPVPPTLNTWQLGPCDISRRFVCQKDPLIGL